MVKDKINLVVQVDVHVRTHTDKITVATSCYIILISPISHLP